MLPVTLSSDRVHLTVPTRSDTAAITQGCQDPAVVRWTTVPTPYTDRDAQTFVDALVGPGWASDREYTWGIRRPGSTDRKSTRLNSSHSGESRMPSSA